MRNPSFRVVRSGRTCAISCRWPRAGCRPSAKNMVTTSVVDVFRYWDNPSMSYRQVWDQWDLRKSPTWTVHLGILKYDIWWYMMNHDDVWWYMQWWIRWYIYCMYIYICKPCTAIASSTALMLFFPSSASWKSVWRAATNEDDQLVGYHHNKAPKVSSRM